MNEDAQAALDFWHDIARINAVVADELAKPGATLPEISLFTRDALQGASTAMIERIMRFTLMLLEIPRMAPDRRGDDAETMSVRPLYSDIVLERIEGRHLSRDEYRGRGDELLMENLTAAWLGLYFLGVPFTHPWEKVRRLADYRGGFPSGGCIAKYVGDVYRLARQRIVDRRRFNWQRQEEILVLSHTPLVMFREVLIFHDQSNATPRALHELGRRYMLLQMRLYFNAQMPVHFFVPIEALTQSLNTLAGIPDDLPGPPDDAMRKRRDAVRSQVGDWLFDTMFPQPAAEQSVHLLCLPLEASGMPTCILGPRTGIYTLESGESGLHFAGNEIREDLLDSYRGKLGKLLALARAEAERNRQHPQPGKERILDVFGMGRPAFEQVLAAR
ncbi:MAG: hypothetical protein AB1807_09950 [Pseudomonadota bacterium]